MLQNLYDALTEAQIVQLYKRVRPIPRWVTSRPHRRSWKWLARQLSTMAPCPILN